MSDKVSQTSNPIYSLQSKRFERFPISCPGYELLHKHSAEAFRHGLLCRVIGELNGTQHLV
jgi:hypothetical protein